MLDVEVVVLHEVEHGAGQLQLLVEALEIGTGQRGPRLVRQAIAIDGHLLSGRLDAVPRPQLPDVAADEPEGVLEVIGPHGIVVVEAGAGGEVEPRLLRAGEVGQPLLTSGLPDERGQHRRERAVAEHLVDAQFHRCTSQTAQLTVGPEQVDVDAGDRARDLQVAELRQQLPAELEVVEVRGVAEVEELEVVLPQLDAQIEHVVIAATEVVGPPHTAPRQHLLRRHHLREIGEGDRVEPAEQVADAHHPGGVELVPVLVVEPSALGEQWLARRDDLWIVDRTGAEVHVAVEDAEVEAAGSRHHVVAMVELAQRDHRILQEGGLERLQRPRPVDGLPKPEHRLLVLAPSSAERQRIAVQRLPALRARRRGDVVRACGARGHCPLVRTTRRRNARPGIP